jgi:hypothetical protein
MVMNDLICDFFYLVMVDLWDHLRENLKETMGFDQVAS